MEQITIYGAKSTALGVCLAVQKLYSSCEIIGFIVKSRENNPDRLVGLPVWELSEVTQRQLKILIAVPENLHAEIIKDLGKHGFFNYICIDSKKEAKLMQDYYAHIGKFLSIHTLPEGEKKSVLNVYMAKFHKDKTLKNCYKKVDWIFPIQVGAALTEERTEFICDNEGENISNKNVNYCELTALYWVWKNKIQKETGKKIDYYGLFHYRRVLDITESDVLKLKEGNIDVILPYPMVHEPNMSEHHTRYVKETDWCAMKQALEELQPEYAKAFGKILAQPYLYNYNILVAKTKVLADYCEWLFPILQRTEELSVPQGWERSDRYIGYLGENLMTLYFMYNVNGLKIFHAGRIMLT